MFINFSNHSSERWDETQCNEAHKYGEIVDIPFPRVLPDGDEDYIERLADESVNAILNVNASPKAVLVQGEYNLTYAVVRRLLKKGIRVVSACTDRDVIVKKNPSGETMTESKFIFTRFRDYRN